jgi:hypothetical protein
MLDAAAKAVAQQADPNSETLKCGLTPPSKTVWLPAHTTTLASHPGHAA